MLGRQVSKSAGGMEALELLKENPDRFDIVLTDMTMPMMSGNELAERILEIRPEVPVMLCTGFGLAMDEEKALAANIKAVIFKPILKADLAVTIRKILDNDARNWKSSVLRRMG